jgi:YHYH protein
VNFKKTFLCIILSLFAIFSLYAHEGGHENGKTETYYIKGKAVNGHFLMTKNDKVFLELKNGKTISAPMADFSFSNQHDLSQKIAHFKALNGQIEQGKESINQQFYFYFILSICLIFICLYLKKYKKNVLPKMAFISFIFIAFLYACKTAENVDPGTSTTTFSIPKTDVAFLETIFSTFKTLVKTRSDASFFYVESEGIPAHNMMVGITNWQQQVPIPQGYTGSNAWVIPLQPEYATTPLSLKTNLLKGAVAIAPNGIPIFNPLNNRGEDAYAIGELDQWGGHCGKADDYHYHIAPLHFEATSGKNPIAMALDGFGIYGSKEADGTTMQTLDANHGHAIGTGTYHYHATTTYPYFIGAMRGKISLDPASSAPENQISPQAKMTPIRPPGEPLKGAVITNFKTTGTNAYSLEYSLTGKKAYVNYAWDAANKYTFTFIDIDGKSSTSTYSKK